MFRCWVECWSRLSKVLTFVVVLSLCLYKIVIRVLQMCLLRDYFWSSKTRCDTNTGQFDLENIVVNAIESFSHIQEACMDPFSMINSLSPVICNRQQLPEPSMTKHNTQRGREHTEERWRHKKEESRETWVANWMAEKEVVDQIRKGYMKGKRSLVKWQMSTGVGCAYRKWWIQEVMDQY